MKHKPSNPTIFKSLLPNGFLILIALKPTTQMTYSKPKGEHNLYAPFNEEYELIVDDETIENNNRNCP